MLLVPLRNQLVHQALTQRVVDNVPIAPIDLAGDYNGNSWGVCSPDNGDLTIVTLRSPMWATVNAFGAGDDVAEKLAPFGMKVTPASSASPDAPSLTIEISKSAIPAGKEQAAIEAVLDVPCDIALPLFVDAFEKLKAKAEATALRVATTPSESMYIFVHKSNVCVVLSLFCAHEDDALYAKQFLSEWAHIRKTGSFSGAPSFSASFGKRPLSMSAVPSAEAEEDGRLWVEFTLFDSHGGAKLRKAVEMILMCRATMTYHIVCTKAAMHTAMRKRVESSLLVMNRAKTHATGRTKTQVR